MARPSNKSELLDQMETEYHRLLEAFDQLSEDAKLEPGACEAWSAKDLLAHLDAWHEMFLGWEKDGRAGGQPEMPAAGFAWSETPALNEQIFQRTREDPLRDVEARLADSYGRVRAVVQSYDPADLFEKKLYGWTGSTSVGSYAVSATSSHYAWATALMKRFARQRSASAAR